VMYLIHLLSSWQCQQLKLQAPWFMIFSRIVKPMSTQTPMGTHTSISIPLMFTVCHNQHDRLPAMAPSLMAVPMVAWLVQMSFCSTQQCYRTWPKLRPSYARSTATAITLLQ
jgi:hypothetical protein